MYDKCIQLNPTVSDYYNNKGLQFPYDLGNSLKKL